MVPTGNVDIFNIDVDCNSCEIPTFQPVKDKDVLGKIFVDDQVGNYLYQQNLNIFTNSYYQNTNKIAPGVSNTYHFVVHNSNDKEMNYNIELFEENNYNINMQYRLKKNDKYIFGDDNNWLKCEKIKTEIANIKTNESDNYSLDWKWIDSQNDNDIGKNINSNYKLNIRIKFEENDAA